MKKLKVLCALAMLIAFLPSCKKSEVPVLEHKVVTAQDVENIHTASDVIALANKITPMTAVIAPDSLMLNIVVEAIGVDIDSSKVTSIGSLRGSNDEAIGYTYVFQVDDLNAIVVNQLFDGTISSFWGVLDGHGFIMLEPGFINICGGPQGTPCWYELFL